MEFIRCFGCMEETTGYPCSRCGYDPEKHPAQAYTLRPGTILKGKYVVGVLLGQGGFGITYIGWDLVADRKVAIKEYFPSGQVSRNVATGNVLQWLYYGSGAFCPEQRHGDLPEGSPENGAGCHDPAGCERAGSVRGECHCLHRHGLRGRRDPERPAEEDRAAVLGRSPENIPAGGGRHGAGPSGRPDPP